MFFENQQKGFENLIAKAANLCNKPFIHSVVKVKGEYASDPHEIDLTINILCRDIDGKRLDIYDLEIEIYTSNRELILVITKLNYPNEPILWSGHRNLWMDGKNGNKTSSPNYGFKVENLASRVKTLLLKEF